jgi:hypothetical protein
MLPPRLSCHANTKRLDVAQHMTLCRHYVRHLRRSVLADTPDNERSSKRSSGAGGEVTDPDPAGPSEKRSVSDNRISAILRNDRGSPHGHSHSNSQASNYSHHSSPAGPHPPRPSYLSSTSGTPATGQEQSGSSSSPHNGVNRQDVRASVERILYTYLLPGAEREIILPQSIVNQITQEIEENGRDDPEVFDAAKDYVFQAMDRDAFPGFLQSKALGNLVPPSIMMRLILGMFGLFAAFWTGFVLIFLDMSRSTRCWVSSLLGVFALLTHPADLAVHHRHLRAEHVRVDARPHPCLHRTVRVHVHELQPHPRAVCSAIAHQAGDHGVFDVFDHRCGPVLPLYLRSWETIMMI